jgi:hypothetical protein
MDSPFEEMEGAEEWEEAASHTPAELVPGELQTAPALLPELHSKLQAELHIPLSVLSQVRVPPPLRAHRQYGVGQPSEAVVHISPTLRSAAADAVMTTCYRP